MTDRTTPFLRDVPLDVDVDALTFGGWDNDELHELFKFLEFRVLWDRLQETVDNLGERLARSAQVRWRLIGYGVRIWTCTTSTSSSASSVISRLMEVGVSCSKPMM